MFQTVSTTELNGLQDRAGIEGSLCVLYQNRVTGELYRWDPVNGNMVPVAASTVSQGQILTAGPGDATKLKKWAVKRGAVRSGVGPARILWIGTSVARGAGAENAALTNAANWVSAPATRLAAFLNANGLPATANTFCGDGGYQLALATGYDARVTFGTGWVYTAASTRQTMGGTSFQNSTTTKSGTTNSLALDFTARAFDTIETYAYKGAQSYSVSIDGGASLGTISLAGAGYQKTVTSCTLATHTVEIDRVTGTIDFAACFAYNSAVPEVLVINAGIGGGRADSGGSIATAWTGVNSSGPFDWDRTASGASQTWGLIAPDLTVLGLSINDGVAATNPVAYATSIQTLITAAKLYGDVILYNEPPSDPAAIPLATQQVYWNAMKALAQANNVICVDFPARWGSRAEVLAGYFDQYHPNKRLYADIASTIGAVVLS